MLKYELGQTVYYVYKNMMVKDVITGRAFVENEKFPPHPVCISATSIQNGEFYGVKGRDGMIREDLLYPSVNDLINDLIDGMWNVEQGEKENDDSLQPLRR